MARQINGHVGNFITSAELTSKYPPSEYMGCSANVGSSLPYAKYWCDGVSWAGFDSQSIQALTAPGLLSGVTYDSSNRAVTWNIDDITYTANYSSSTITVAASDGTITYIGTDPAQRITSVSTT